MSTISKTYTYGEGMTLPQNVTKTDCVFKGWYDNSELSGSEITSILTSEYGNKEFYAKYGPALNYVSATYGTDWTSKGLVSHKDESSSGYFYGSILRAVGPNYTETWIENYDSEDDKIYGSINPYSKSTYFYSGTNGYFGVGGIHCIGVDVKTNVLITKIEVSPYAAHANRYTAGTYAKSNTITRDSDGYVYPTYGSRPGSKSSGYYILSYGNNITMKQTIVDDEETYVVQVVKSTGKNFSDGYTSKSTSLTKTTVTFDFVTQLDSLCLSHNARTTEVEFYTPYNNVNYIGMLINGIQIYKNK